MEFMKLKTPRRRDLANLAAPRKTECSIYPNRYALLLETTRFSLCIVANTAANSILRAVRVTELVCHQFRRKCDLGPCFQSGWCKDSYNQLAGHSCILADFRAQHRRVGRTFDSPGHTQTGGNAVKQSCTIRHRCAHLIVFPL